jgi:multidrug efflux pump subunit AcrB
MNKAIKWMSENHVAANLFMVLIIFSGFLTISNIKMEVFPEMEMDQVQISVIYPGASPDEMEASIIIKIEDALKGISEITSINSIASEGIATVTAEVDMNEDVTEIKDLIKAEVDRITTFPELIEEPVIKELTNRRQVLQIAVFGDTDEKSLKRLAYEIEDELTLSEHISQVSVSGVRNDEISIEVSEDKLREYGLTLSEVTMAIRKGSLDLPGGDIQTQKGEILLRTKTLGYTREAYENVILRGSYSGDIIRIKDIGRVVDGFEEADLVSSFDGKRAAMVSVYRVGEQDAPKVAAEVYEYLEQKRKTLPENIALEVWRDTSILLNQRISLLTNNALLGLFLVLLSLSLLLEIRLAFWVAVGIVISFFGSFVIMQMMDVSINMISLFAFILVLGIVVDDAIVVGENIFSSQQKGLEPQKAASVGASRVARPVFFAVATSIAAFLPMVFVEGNMGKFMAVIPIVVISALTFSLFESIYILPAHLANVNIEKKFGFLNKVDAARKKVADALDRFIHNTYSDLLKLALKNRYVTIAIAIAVLLVSIGLLSSGILGFTFMPKVEADNIIVQLSLPQGSSSEQTLKIVKRIEQAALKVEKIVNENYDIEAESVFEHVYSSVGDQPSKGGMQARNSVIIKPELGEVNVQLVSSEYRDISATHILNMWREAVGDLPNLESISFSSNLMSLGGDVDVQLTANRFEKLDAAVEAVKAALANYSGVYEIRDDFETGKRELRINLTPQAASMGITVQDLANQVRQAFYGSEAFRIQRGKDEVKVMVRFPLAERNSLNDISRMRIRTASGKEVAFNEAATVEYGYGYSQIKRVDGRRVIAVKASVDETLANINQINDEIKRNIIPAIAKNYPTLSFSYEGVQKEQQKSMASLAIGYIIILFVMYGLLAIPFKSYIQPLVIMSAIPFGIIGSLWGHILLGFDLSFISIMGVVALSGVVINDSLILIDFVNELRDKGYSMFDAVIAAGQQRFRPIILTSITTFLGLMPMILETSLQARFLIPMAISLGFGVLSGTGIILLMVPASVLIIEDIQKKLNGLKN